MRESVEVYQMGQQSAGSKDVEGGADVVVVVHSAVLLLLCLIQQLSQSFK